MNQAAARTEWFTNVPSELVAGLVVALALIPEAIAFSVIAGVDPAVGLYASFCIAVVTAFSGGRPGMISGATASMALLMPTLVKEHGLQYLLAATLMTGVLQIIAGRLRLGDALKYVPPSVLTGFVNALAILIFLAQLPEIRAAGWQTLAMIAGGLAIIYLLPRFTKAVPSSLVCIITLSTLAFFTGMNLRTVSDLGQLPSAIPIFLFPNVPINLETFWIIAPYAISFALVGLLESLMTAVVLDEITATNSDKNRECAGQGAANVVTACFGGMAGCAMIGQTVVNMSAGGRGRLSAFAAGVFLLILVVVGGAWVKMIPMPALVAVMIMVSIGTFNWSSLREIGKTPWIQKLIMVTTVVIIVFSHNLAIGVMIGTGMHAVWVGLNSLAGRTSDLK